jgi:hypothetical protein
MKAGRGLYFYAADAEDKTDSMLDHETFR